METSAATADHASGCSLERILDNVGDSFVAYDLEWRFVFVNREAERYLRRPREELLGRVLWEVYPEAVGGEMHAVFVAVMREQRPRELEVQGVISDSWFALRLHPSPEGLAVYAVDITARRADLAAVRASEARYRAIFENSLDGILITAPTGEILAANPAACRMYGRDEADICRLGRAGVVAEDDPRLAAFLEERRRTGRVRCELTGRRGDGTEFPVEAASSVFLNAEGQARTIIVLRDLTERHAAEAALRRSEALLRGVLEALPVGVWIADATGTITMGNPAGRAIWAGVHYVGPERFGVYKAWWAETGEPLAPDDWAVARAVRDGETSIGEVLDIECFDGSRKTILNSAIPLHDPEGHLEAVVVVNEDVTVMRRFEHEQRFLAEAGRILQSTLDLDATLQGLVRLVVPGLADICLVDAREDDAVTRVAVAHRDPAMEPHLGLHQRYAYNPARDAGVHRALRTGAPELVPEVTPAWLAAVSDDSHHAAKAGAHAPMTAMVVPLTAHGRTFGAMVFARQGPAAPYDARELALAERLALRAALALEHARLYERALAATRARDDVLGVVSHDLRNPLHAVTLHAQLLRRGALNSAAAAEALESILRSAARANRLIQDLLEVAKVEAGALPLDRRDERLGPLIDEALALHRPAARERDVGFETAVPALPVVRADRHRVLQVLSNLLDNALKFSPGGSVVRVAATLEDGAVCVSVSDAGPGINPEDLPHVFDRFWQARRTRRAGAGLGLAIARAVVEAHGGRIWAESAPGQGATFRFTLPV